MSRGVGAALVAAAVVLSGCSSVEENVTTTSPSPETPINPWDLPLEDRPALFDPCAEIPVEAVEEGVESPVTRDDQFLLSKPGELLACGWRSDEVIFSALSTWKSRDEYLNDRAFVASENSMNGRPGLELRDTVGTRSCQQAFFTSSGTIFLAIDLITGLTTFRGEHFSDPCEALAEVTLPILDALPDGDHQ